MDDMAEIERVWVGVGVKIKKSGNVDITARTWRLKYVGLYFDTCVGEGQLFSPL